MNFFSVSSRARLATRPPSNDESEQHPVKEEIAHNGADFMQDRDNHNHGTGYGEPLLRAKVDYKSQRKRHCHPTTALILALVVSMLLLTVQSVQALSEPERVAEYDKRYPRKWPPKDYVPNTAWKRVHEKRFKQINEIDDYNERYEGYMQSVFAAFLVQNFTELGFGLARAPSELTQALQEGIQQSLQNGQAYLEKVVGPLEGPNPWFIERPDLTSRVLKELLAPTEAWSGIRLKPHEAYGFRLCQNHSVASMQVDKKESHILSIIYHIDHSADSLPWPLFIEDYLGRTHEIVLAPGDMLLYEGAKLLHGRMKPFVGSWYTSVFVHYYPADDGWSSFDPVMESHYIIPPDWSQAKSKKTERPLRMVGTAFKEPTCPNGWCATMNTVKWKAGLAQDGYIIDPNKVKRPFEYESFGQCDEL